MRRILLLLVLANVLAFAWLHGSLGDWFGSPREPDRMSRQVNPDALRPLPPTGKDGGTGAGATPAVATAPPPPVCLELGPIEEARAARLRALVEGSGGKLEGRFEPIVRQAVWMVYTPPAESAAIAQRRVAELQRSGIVDIYLMPEGPYRNAISFGLFRTEEAARAHGENLGRQGVRGIRVTQRNPSEPRSMVELRHAGDLDVSAPALRDQLSGLFAELGLNPVPCHGNS